VDVLVEFQPGQRVGYIRLAEMELALSDCRPLSTS
jgi:predicted nucleotidyltransferase